MCFTAPCKDLQHAILSAWIQVIYRIGLGIAVVAPHPKLHERLVLDESSDPGVVGTGAEVAQVTRQQILSFQKMRSENVAPDTVNGDMGYLKAWLNWCRAEGLMEHDPCFKVKRIKVNRTRRHTMSPDEMEGILKAVKDDGVQRFGANENLSPILHDYVLAAANTGMRPNELLHVRGCDLDVPKTLLHITAWGDWQTKDAEDRTISLNATALDIFARRKLANGDDALPLFAGREGVVRDWKNVSKELKKKLPENLGWVSLYEFRHYFATEAVKLGWSAERLRVYLGHADISTTMRYYADMKAEQVGAPPVVAIG